MFLTWLYCRLKEVEEQSLAVTTPSHRYFVSKVYPATAIYPLVLRLHLNFSLRASSLPIVLLEHRSRVSTLPLFSAVVNWWFLGKNFPCGPQTEKPLLLSASHATAFVD